MNKTSSYCSHCGEPNKSSHFKNGNNYFCCEGCQAVYEILKGNNLSSYYDETHGLSPKDNFKEKFAFLSNTSISDKLIDFKDDDISIVTFTISKIHCSSCIWLLEQLYKINEYISSSRVNFLKKTIRIVFHHHKVNLREVVELLAKLGYEPTIRMQEIEKKTSKKDRSSAYKIGVAGFCFGNIMLFSLPNYFQMDRFIFNDFYHFFGYISLILSIPALFYSGSYYFKSAFTGFKAKFINIDVPIALGMIALFLRSTFELISETGEGYFDSLSGLVFFLLLGKYFQKVTYQSLSFERDYKSYFPLAASRIENGHEKSIPITDIKVNDIILIRNQEIIPVDCMLQKGRANIDNSFVTGESKTIHKTKGDTIYAGGKQVGESIEVKVIKTISQSYLTQLWNHSTFKKASSSIHTITDKISKYFTIIILTLSAISATYWWRESPGIAINVFTSVLIIACPCALALSAPFTLGNILRIFGKQKLYLKNAEVIEKMAGVKQLVFDKTGTITQTNNEDIHFIGDPLNIEEKKQLAAVVRHSSHPLSKAIYQWLAINTSIKTHQFEEKTGQGISAVVNEKKLKIGSKKFVGIENKIHEKESQVWVRIDTRIRGYFSLKNKYRAGLKKLMNQLKPYALFLLSGDNNSEANTLMKWFSKDNLLFEKSPKDKLNFIQDLQKKYPHPTMMIGDGLNDAGALKQANVGIAVSDDVNAFTPACDGILDAAQLTRLPYFLTLAKQSIIIIIISFIISFLYNTVGLYFAISGSLSPLIAAILMPLSSITVVVFVTLATYIASRTKV